MAKKPYPTDVVSQAQTVLQVWGQINSSLAFGPVSVGALNAEILTAKELETNLTKLEASLTDLRNQRDTLSASLWDKVKRVRSGFKANFGDDSSQYEMIGGTRASERKSAKRKATTE